EMVLGPPEAVIAEFVHDLRDALRRLEHLGQPLVGIAPVVCRGAVEPDIVEIDLADIERVKPLYHESSLAIDTVIRLTLRGPHACRRRAPARCLRRGRRHRATAASAAAVPARNGRAARRSAGPPRRC